MTNTRLMIATAAILIASAGVMGSSAGRPEGSPLATDPSKAASAPRAVAAQGPLVIEAEVADAEAHRLAKADATVPTRAIAGVTDPKQEVGRIADHIKENYARLRTLRVLLQTKLVDRSVAQREEVTSKSSK